MRKSNRIARVLAAAILSVSMAAPVLAADSGMNEDNNTFVCAFAQGIILKVPGHARTTLATVFGAITGCVLSAS